MVKWGDAREDDKFPAWVILECVCVCDLKETKREPEKRASKNEYERSARRIQSTAYSEIEDTENEKQERQREHFLFPSIIWTLSRLVSYVRDNSSGLTDADVIVRLPYGLCWVWWWFWWCRLGCWYWDMIGAGGACMFSCCCCPFACWFSRNDERRPPELFTG